MWKCDCCQQNVISLVKQQQQQQQQHYSHRRHVCFTCHWFHNPLIGLALNAATCLQCISNNNPCREHAQAVAMSIALESLQSLRQGRGVAPNTLVSQKEHDFATTIQNVKLQEFISSRVLFHAVREQGSNDLMMMMMGDTDEVKMATTTPALSRSNKNKRSATVTPPPEVSTGANENMHTTCSQGIIGCAACFQNPAHHRHGQERASKRARSDDATTCTDNDMIMVD